MTPAPVAALALAAGLGAGGLVPAPAQEIAPAVRAELVQIDVIVVDAQGKPVRDLTRDDFQVLEDGKPQRIAHFILAGPNRAALAAPAPAPASTGAAATPAAATPAATPAPARGPARRVVIVVDDLHIARGNLDYAKQALERFVSEFVAPEDEVALVTTSAGPVQQLTLDRAVLGAAIQRLALRDVNLPLPRGSRMTAAQAELILRGDRNALRLAARVMIDEPGSVFAAPGSPQAAAEAGGGSPGASIASDPERAGEKAAERLARGVLAESLRFSSVTLGAVEGVMRSMAAAPGRKICLLVSDGFLVGAATGEERTRDLQRVIDAATRSGAVVYALDTRGLVPTGGDAGVEGVGAPPGLQSSIDRQSEQLHRDTLRGVANDTGGFLVSGTNDLASGLRRMLDDSDSYYLLAYEPLNTKRDGRFRKIEVKIPGRRDLKLRTRKGYFAPDDRKVATAASSSTPVLPAASPTAPDALEETEARAALAAPLPANGIPVALSADFVQLPPGGPQAIIRAHVDLNRMRWHEAAGRRQASVELVAGVYDADGKLVGAPLGRVAELDLSPPEYERAARNGLQYQQQVALRPGRYHVRMVARERKLVQAGGAAQWVDIPDLGERKLAMSSVFLAGAGMLPRFKPTDRLSFQIYVYNPLVDDKGARDVVLQAQIWSGGKAIAASKPQPVTLQTKDGAPVPETNEMPLEGLAAGPYELRVVVVDRKANATIFRKVDFTVE
jgi:VWFA-related protein